jgi:hypothetical protein
MSLSTLAVTEALSHPKPTFAVNFKGLFPLRFNRRVTMCRPPAFKQGFHLLQILLDSQQRYYFEMLTVPLREEL